MEEVSNLSAELHRERRKLRSIWRLHCEQLAQWDDEGANKDAEIVSLRSMVATFGVSERVREDPTFAAAFSILPTSTSVIHGTHSTPLSEISPVSVAPLMGSTAISSGILVLTSVSAYGMVGMTTPPSVQLSRNAATFRAPPKQSMALPLVLPLPLPLEQPGLLDRVKHHQWMRTLEKM